MRLAVLRFAAVLDLAAFLTVLRFAAALDLAAFLTVLRFVAVLDFAVLGLAVVVALRLTAISISSKQQTLNY